MLDSAQKRTFTPTRQILPQLQVAQTDIQPVSGPLLDGEHFTEEESLAQKRQVTLSHSFGPS
jgi:hypothetical protein